MAATNNSLTLGQTATVPAPEQAPSGTFEKNVSSWSSSAELYRPYDQDAQVSPGLIPHKLMPLKACTANPTPAPTTQLVTTHDSPIRVDHSCVTQRAPMDALPTVGGKNILRPLS
jgi:hypothetical protein